MTILSSRQQNQEELTQSGSRNSTAKTNTMKIWADYFQELFNNKDPEYNKVWGGNHEEHNALNTTEGNQAPDKDEEQQDKEWSHIQ